MLLSCRQSEVNVLQFVVAPNYFTLNCNVKSVLVEVVIFAIVNVVNFCEDRSIFVWFKLSGETNGRNVVLNSEQKMVKSIRMCNELSIVEQRSCFLIL